MKRTVLLAAFAAAFFLGACSNESNLPTATGKGSIRALNAIKTSPEIAFKIESRSIGAAEYRQVTTELRAEKQDDPRAQSILDRLDAWVLEIGLFDA